VRIQSTSNGQRIRSFVDSLRASSRRNAGVLYRFELLVGIYLTHSQLLHSISNDFSQLSVGDLYASSQPTIAQALERIYLQRDVFTDDDHKPLDAKVLKVFRASRKFDEEPDLPSLL
jgi:hypothetical protein